MSTPQDQMENAARQQQLGNLGGLGATAAPRPPTNLEEAIQKVHRLIESHGEIINRQNNMIDRINGPRPEKEQLAQEVATAAGQLSELHRLLDIIEGQTQEIAGRLEVIDCSV
jgi:hypothetical protein